MDIPGLGTRSQYEETESHSLAEEFDPYPLRSELGILISAHDCHGTFVHTLIMLC